MVEPLGGQADPPQGRQVHGAAGNPAWYDNIAAHPDKVRIEVDGRKVAVVAEQLHGAERAEAGEQIIAAVARFGQYQRKTERELPIIRLVPPVRAGWHRINEARMQL